MSEEWILVDPTALNRPKQQKVDGTEVTILASPYDVPDAYRSYFDANRKRHVLQFRYLTEEDTKRENYGPYITLLIGKNSARIYGIEVDVEALTERRWLPVTCKAIDDREEKAGQRRSLNYAVARRLLRENAPRLEASFA